MFHTLLILTKLNFDFRFPEKIDLVIAKHLKLGSEKKFPIFSIVKNNVKIKIETCTRTTRNCKKM